jgi:hypothetical protein
VPVLDMTRVYPFVKERGARLLGPNCPGLISSGKSKVGIIPGRICTPGPVGVVSRSGTLTYEIVYQLTRAGSGRRRASGFGGDPINGTNFIDCLTAFEAGSETKAVAMMGEIGGTDEQEAARFVKDHMTKPSSASSPVRRRRRAGAWDTLARSSPVRPDRGGEDPGIRGRRDGRRTPAHRLRGADQSATLKISDFVPANQVVVPLRHDTLMGAADELMGRLAAAGGVTNVEKLRERVTEEQPEDIVAMGDRAFLLHYRTDAVTVSAWHSVPRSGRSVARSGTARPSARGLCCSSSRHESSLPSTCSSWAHSPVCCRSGRSSTRSSRSLTRGRLRRSMRSASTSSRRSCPSATS